MFTSEKLRCHWVGIILHQIVDRQMIAWDLHKGKTFRSMARYLISLVVCILSYQCCKMTFLTCIFLLLLPFIYFMENIGLRIWHCCMEIMRCLGKWSKWREKIYIFFITLIPYTWLCFVSALLLERWVFVGGRSTSLLSLFPILWILPFCPCTHYHCQCPIGPSSL